MNDLQLVGVAQTLADLNQKGNPFGHRKGTPASLVLAERLAFEVRHDQVDAAGPSVSPRRRMGQTLGWLSRVAMVASRRSRSTEAGSRDRRGIRILTATDLPVPISCA